MPYYNIDPISLGGEHYVLATYADVLLPPLEIISPKGVIGLSLLTASASAEQGPIGSVGLDIPFFTVTSLAEQGPIGTFNANLPKLEVLAGKEFTYELTSDVVFLVSAIGRTENQSQGSISLPKLLCGASAKVHQHSNFDIDLLPLVASAHGISGGIYSSACQAPCLTVSGSAIMSQQAEGVGVLGGLEMQGMISTARGTLILGYVNAGSYWQWET